MQHIQEWESLPESRDKCPSFECRRARRESATRSQWRTERGRLATAATAPHGLHPLSRLWPSNSLPARRAHLNAPAAPADCQCYPGRRASEPGRTSAVSREDSAIVIGISCSNFNSTRWPGRRPPAELPSHPAPAPPCLRESVEGAQNLTKTSTGHAPLGSRGAASRDCNNSEHTRTRLSS